MSEAKYGMLFTEADVLLIMRKAGAGADWSEVLPVVEEIGLTFPPDEPLFLLRASDDDTEDMLTNSIGSLEGEEDDSAVSRACMEVWEVRNSFMQWKVENPDRVKESG